MLPVRHIVTILYKPFCFTYYTNLLHTSSSSSSFKDLYSAIYRSRPGALTIFGLSGLMTMFALYHFHFFLKYKRDTGI